MAQEAFHIQHSQDTDDVPETKVQNVVAGANLCCSLDLTEIYSRTKGSTYHPDRFKAVILKLRNPKATVLIFESGKIQINGAKTPDLSNLAARMAARLIQKLGFDVQFRDFKVQNIVSTFQMGFDIPLNKLYEEYKKYCRYQPDLQARLHFYLGDPEVTLLVHANGKVIVTGLKSEEDAKKATRIMYSVFKPFEETKTEEDESDETDDDDDEGVEEDYEESEEDYVESEEGDNIEGEEGSVEIKEEENGEEMEEEEEDEGGEE